MSRGLHIVVLLAVASTTTALTLQNSTQIAQAAGLPMPQRPPLQPQPPSPGPGWSPPPPSPTTPGWSPPTSTPGWAPPTTTPGWNPPTPGWTTVAPTDPPTTPGWSPPPPTTTPGWPAPTTTPGWTTVPPTDPPTTPGWSVPTTTAGWTTTPSPLETTTGWSVQTTTPGWPGKLTSGWQPPTPPPTPGWIAPPTTIGWSAPVPPTSGWSPSPPSGWSPSPPTGWPASSPAVDIEMEGEAAVVGGGAAGASHSSNTIAIGDSSNPAILDLYTGSYATLDQLAGVTQISSADPETGESSTAQLVEGHNIADAGEYYEGHITGNYISVQNEGSSFAVGEGAIGLAGSTENNASS